MKTFLLSLVLALGAMFSGLALATQPGNNGGGNGGCGVGQQTNGCGGQGGAGGAGGQGGTGIGVGIAGAAATAQANAAAVAGANATGGNAAVVGSGNSTNHNANVQGQSQSSRNTNTNDNRSAANATGGAGGASSATSGGNTMSVSVQGAQGDIFMEASNPKPAAASAAPVYVNPPSADVCQRAGFGLSLQGYGGGGAISAGGSESDTCEARADAVNLKFTGAPDAVIRARQCQNPKMAKAFEDAGILCKVAAKASGAAVTQPAAHAVASNEPADPFIRRRLGLPPQ